MIPHEKGLVKGNFRFFAKKDPLVSEGGYGEGEI